MAGGVEQRQSSGLHGGEPCAARRRLSPRLAGKPRLNAGWVYPVVAIISPVLGSLCHAASSNRIFVVQSSPNRRRLQAVPVAPAGRHLRFWQAGPQAGLGTSAMIVATHSVRNWRTPSGISTAATNMGSTLLDWTSGSGPDAHLVCHDSVANYSTFSGVLRPAEPGRRGGRALVEKIVQKLSRTTMRANGANLGKDGSSGWIRTSNPPVNSGVSVGWPRVSGVCR